MGQTGTKQATLPESGNETNIGPPAELNANNDNCCGIEIDGATECAPHGVTRKCGDCLVTRKIFVRLNLMISSFSLRRSGIKIFPWLDWLITLFVHCRGEHGDEYQCRHRHEDDLAAAKDAGG